MFEKLCENLNFLMDRDGINSNELARKTGIPASTIKKIRNNHNPNPTLTTLIPLAKAFTLSVSQLIGENNIEDKNFESQKWREIPILSWHDANKWPKEKLESHHTIRTFNPYSSESFGLHIESDGFIDLPRGTTILIEPKCEPNHMDIVLIDKIASYRPTLKQLIYEVDAIYLKSLINGLNITLLTTEFKILGVVMETLRVTKKYI